MRRSLPLAPPATASNSPLPYSPNPHLIISDHRRGASPSLCWMRTLIGEFAGRCFISWERACSQGSNLSPTPTPLPFLRFTVACMHNQHTTSAPNTPPISGTACSPSSESPAPRQWHLLECTAAHCVALTRSAAPPQSSGTAATVQAHFQPPPTPHPSTFKRYQTIWEFYKKAEASFWTGVRVVFVCVLCVQRVSLLTSPHIGLYYNCT